MRHHDAARFEQRAAGVGAVTRESHEPVHRTVDFHPSGDTGLIGDRLFIRQRTAARCKAIQIGVRRQCAGIGEGAIRTQRHTGQRREVDRVRRIGGKQHKDSGGFRGEERCQRCGAAALVPADGGVVGQRDRRSVTGGQGIGCKRESATVDRERSRDRIGTTERERACTLFDKAAAGAACVFEQRLIDADGNILRHMEGDPAVLHLGAGEPLQVIGGVAHRLERASVRDQRGAAVPAYHTLRDKLATRAERQRGACA